MPRPLKQVYTMRLVRDALGGISRSTLLRLIEEGRFPAAISVSPRVEGWLATDVDWFLYGQALGGRLKILGVQECPQVTTGDHNDVSPGTPLEKPKPKG